MVALTGEKSRAESFPQQGMTFELQWSVMSFTSPVVLIPTSSPRSSPGTRTPSRGKIQENSMWRECTTRLWPSRSPSYNVHEFNKISTSLYIFLKGEIVWNILNDSWFRKFLHPASAYLLLLCFKQFEKHHLDWSSSGHRPRAASSKITRGGSTVTICHRPRNSTAIWQTRMSLRVGIRKTRMSLNDGRKPKLFDEVGPTIIYLY